jgi:hypothetical protein
MTKTYTRRTPEEVIADLEAKIEAVKARAAAKETKAAPEGKTFIAAVKAMDKAMAVAQEQKNQDMVRSLEAGRAPLNKHMIEMGIRLPNRRNRKRPSAA